MISSYQLKGGFQRLVRPLATALVGAGITPNQVTIGTMLASLAFAAEVALVPGAGRTATYIAVPVFFLLRMALNAVDGLMAKEWNLTSPLGLFLNELGDVIADAALYLAFIADARIPRMLMIAFVFVALLTEMAGVVAVQVGSKRRYEGPMGKSDRTILIGLLSVLLALDVQKPLLIQAILGLGLVGGGLTVANRVRGALRDARSGSPLPGQ
jgi:CDP-diacylglycerol--glycerol-3-phosphate 3-phosphatidyltransferase